MYPHKFVNPYSSYGYIIIFTHASGDVRYRNARGNSLTDLISEKPALHNPIS
jgi:hypothetical protein